MWTLKVDLVEFGGHPTPLATGVRLWLAPHCPRHVRQLPRRHAARQRGSGQSRRSAMTSRSIISMQRHIMWPFRHSADIKQTM